MNVELPATDRGFNVTRRDGLVLVTPNRTKASRADWRDDELPLRSLVLRDGTGEVLSAGLPKFFNSGEGDNDTKQAPETERLHRALADGEPVHFTEKLDGSLCVRSVIDGQVVLRTRGTLAATPYTEAMRAVAARSYPVLLDPAFLPGTSLCLEFVSPRFRIVLAYPQDDLVLLGAVDHADLRPWDVPELAALAADHALRFVDLVELPTDPAELASTVSGLYGREGVVARCDAGRTMVKLKSASYLALHRLRFALSARRVREICAERNVRVHADFADYLAEFGADWELLADTRPLVSAYLAARAAAEEDLARLDRQVEVRADVDRKTFAVTFAIPLEGAETAAAFALRDGKTRQALQLLLDAKLDLYYAALEAADDTRLAQLAEEES